MNQLRALRVSAVTALVAVAAAGCGSSTSHSSTATAASGSGSATSSSATTSSASNGAGLAQAATLFQSYTGGTAGQASASKPPISIGLMNNQGGVPSFPEGTAAGEAAVKFINQNLGGIAGRPVKLVTCLVAGTESQGQSCAQQFLAQKLPIVVESNGAVGGASFHNTLAGQIPVLMPNPDSAIETTAKNAYGIDSAVFGTDTGFIAYAKTIGAKTASLLFPGDDPVGQTAAKMLEAQMAKVGVKVTPSGFTSNSPNLLPNVIAAGASHTDMTIMLTVSPPSCIAGAKAVKQANLTKPVIGLFLCISPPVKQGLGDYPQWTYVDAATNVDHPTDAATKAYIAVMGADAAPGTNVGGNAQLTFAAILKAARALNKAGAASTATAVSAALKTDNVGAPMADPAVRYGVIPGLTNLPNLGVRLFTYHGNGKWTDVTHGAWVAPPSH